MSGEGTAGPVWPRLALGEFEAGSETFPALVLAGRVFDLRPRLRDCGEIGDLLRDWPNRHPQLLELAAELEDAAQDHEIGSLRPLPPVPPGAQVFQAAANYRRHVLGLLEGARAREDNSDGLSTKARAEAMAELDQRAESGNPFVFLGSAHAIIGANDDVILPRTSQQSDWEVELAVVIGTPGRNLSREQALDVVAGYTICNDLTARDALMREDAGTIGIDWLAGKGSPTFLPTGPLLVPASEVGDPMNLHLQLRLNGKVMQDESSGDMLFDVATILSYISGIAELRPGDIVLTGSPAGNGAAHGVFLSHGDLMEASIVGLGVQRNRCIDEDMVETREPTLR